MNDVSSHFVSPAAPTQSRGFARRSSQLKGKQTAAAGKPHDLGVAGLGPLRFRAALPTEERTSSKGSLAERTLRCHSNRGASSPRSCPSGGSSPPRSQGFHEAPAAKNQGHGSATPGQLQVAVAVSSEYSTRSSGPLGASARRLLALAPGLRLVSEPEPTCTRGVLVYFAPAG